MKIRYINSDTSNDKYEIIIVMTKNNKDKKSTFTLVLSDIDTDIFLEALERPPRPMPESIRKAKLRHNRIIKSDK